jgi:isopenicillin N synthase-like dioxygenase
MPLILDVDLLRFERGDGAARAAVVDGVRRSLGTGFVYVAHDLAEGLIDEAYGLLERFFSLAAAEKQRFVAPGSHCQTGDTGLLVETAATADVPDWKEMLNWGHTLPAGHPLRRKYPHRYMDQVLPEAAVPGIERVLAEFHDRIADVNRRFLRVIAVALGCHEGVFESMLPGAPHLTRAIHYPPVAEAPSGDHVWAGAHGDINLITALPRATARGLQVLTTDGWLDAVAPEGQAIINSGIMLEHLSNGLIPTGLHRVVAAADEPGDRYSVVQFCHPTPWTILVPFASCVTDEHPQRFGAIEAGDRLDEVLYDINLVEDARRVEAIGGSRGGE